MLFYGLLYTSNYMETSNYLKICVASFSRGVKLCMRTGFWWMLGLCGPVTHLLAFLGCATVAIIWVDGFHKVNWLTIIGIENLIYSYTYRHVATSDRVSANDTPGPGSKHVDVHFFHGTIRNTLPTFVISHRFLRWRCHTHKQNIIVIRKHVPNFVHKTFHVRRLMNAINKMMSEWAMYHIACPSIRVKYLRKRSEFNYNISLKIKANKAHYIKKLKM